MTMSICCSQMVVRLQKQLRPVTVATGHLRHADFLSVRYPHLPLDVSPACTKTHAAVMTLLCCAGSSSGSDGLSGVAIGGIVVLATLAALALVLVWRRWHRLPAKRPAAFKWNEISQAMLPGDDAAGVNAIVSAQPTINQSGSNDQTNSFSNTGINPA